MFKDRIQKMFIIPSWKGTYINLIEDDRGVWDKAGQDDPVIPGELRDIHPRGQGPRDTLLSGKLRSGQVGLDKIWYQDRLGQVRLGLIISGQVRSEQVKYRQIR